MRKFLVNVNGNSYEVEVEEIGSGVVSAPAIQPIVVSPAPAVQETPKPEIAPAPKAAPVGANVVSAPMPGTIVSVKVNVGDTVKQGDVLCILEAMKMENEIMAPADGKVVALNTSQGATVDTGDALISLG